jgi:hypothetical protein
MKKFDEEKRAKEMGFKIGKLVPMTEVDKFIKSVKDSAEKKFSSYPGRIKREISLGRDEKKYLRAELDSVIGKYLQTELFDVEKAEEFRNWTRLVLTSIRDGDKFPFDKDIVDLPVTNEEKLHRFIWPQYYRLMQIEYLKRRLNGAIGQGKTLAKGKRFSHVQIALIAFYNGKIISRDNANILASDYGWIAKNSGEKIYHLFLKISQTSNRLSEESTTKKMANKIKRYEDVLPYLSDKGKEQANTEILTLKKRSI